jgi:hypothetical protein
MFAALKGASTAAPHRLFWTWDTHDRLAPGFSKTGESVVCLAARPYALD